ncbi:MAG: DUF4359 domain-containing protein [Synechococcus sp.]
MATPAASIRIYQPAPTPLRSAIPIARQLSAIPLSLVVALVGTATTLAITNPTLKDYQTHAGEQLVDLAIEEICGQRGLPMLMRLWVNDCPAVMASQQTNLAALAGQVSSRLNLGLLSVFSTTVGDQRLIPGLQLPGYTITTVGVAGQFITVSNRSHQGQGQ